MQRLNPPRSDASGLERAGLLTDAPTYRGGSQNGIFFSEYNFILYSEYNFISYSDYNFTYDLKQPLIQIQIH